MARKANVSTNAMAILYLQRELLQQWQKEGKKDKDLAAKADVHPSQISKIRKDGAGVSAETVEAIARALGKDYVGFLVEARKWFQTQPEASAGLRAVAKHPELAAALEFLSPRLPPEFLEEFRKKALRESHEWDRYDWMQAIMLEHRDWRAAHPAESSPPPPASERMAEVRLLPVSPSGKHRR
jgi:transcriptional regulator with XRE-family HTH domain